MTVATRWCFILHLMKERAFNSAVQTPQMCGSVLCITFFFLFLGVFFFFFIDELWLCAAWGQGELFMPHRVFFFFFFFQSPSLKDSQ